MDGELARLYQVAVRAEDAWNDLCASYGRRTHFPRISVEEIKVWVSDRTTCKECGCTSDKGGTMRPTGKFEVVIDGRMYGDPNRGRTREECESEMASMLAERDSLRAAERSAWDAYYRYQKSVSEAPGRRPLEASRSTGKKAVPKKPHRDRGREYLSPKARFFVLKRDGFACRYCGTKGDSATLHVDHVHPVSLGGTNHPDNLVTACIPCNLGKGATPVQQVA